MLLDGVRHLRERTESRGLEVGAWATRGMAFLVMEEEWSSQ